MKLNMRLITWGLPLILLAAQSCKSGEEKKTAEEVEETTPLFERLDPATCGVDFVNKLVETDSASILTYEYIYNGSGVGVGDIDNDGLQDLFFTSNQGTSRLYRNLGDMKFEDITEKAGVTTSSWCSGVTMADVNNDGLVDIYVCRSSAMASPAERANLLFINNGDLTFTEKGEQYGVNDPGYSTTGVFFDMDNDGDLDLFVGNHGDNIKFDIRDNHARKKENDYTTDHMYENMGNGTFSDITTKAGMESFAFCLAVVTTDFNNDGWMDLYVSNDYFFPDFLYINNGNGTFSEKLSDYMKHTATNSMGVDLGDMNNDGMLDLVALDMLPEDNFRKKTLQGARNFDLYITRVNYGYGHQYMKNVLQLNRGNGEMFTDIANYAGIEATDWSWSPLLADFDNDGEKDLYVTNGYMREVTDYDFMKYEANYRNQHQRGLTAAELAKYLPEKRIPNYAYRNNGDLTFENVSKKWGLDEPLISNGAAYVDLDNDGALDIVTCNINDPAAIYRNLSREQNGNHYLQVKLDPEKIHKDAPGTKVFVTAGGKTQMVEYMRTRGYQSSSTPVLHFGLGKAETVDEVRVLWPGGLVTQLSSVKADQTITITDKDAGPAQPDEVDEAWFVDLAQKLGIDHMHNESGFIDFKAEPLIPHMMSKKGPGIAVGDVNSDGLDDFIVTGAAGFETTLYLQSKNGKFTRQKNMPWSREIECEDLGVLLFDADGDNDLDLYITAGSNEFAENSPLYKDRLYINNSSGSNVSFQETVDALPEMYVSASVVTAADWDGDGDMDLFVGGGPRQGNYPLGARSCLLQNNGGKFTDVTSELCPRLIEPGMISMAVFADYNGDGKTDLAVTGKWMPIRIFENTGNGFIEKTEAVGLSGYTGWWNSLLPVDIDNDGDIDFIAGNQGLNSQFRTSDSKPLRLYYGDFDKNDDLDAICTQYYGNVEAPIYAMAEMARQMSYFMNSRIKRHYEYAGLNIELLLGETMGNKQGILDAKELASVVLLNNGGTFTVKRLPVEAQLSQVFGMQAVDVNNDGFLDILAVGNAYDTKVELGWDNSMNGLVLLGDGKGNFKSAPSTGFYTPYNAKSLAVINVGGKPVFLVGNNHEKMQVFGFNPDMIKNRSDLWMGIGAFGGYLSQNTYNKAPVN